MTLLRLTRLDRNLPIANPDGTPTDQFQRLYNNAMAAIEANDAVQQEQIDELIAVSKRDRRSASYTSPTAVLTASDAGASATITIASHTRVYSDATPLAITGGALTGLAYSTTYTVYYDDTTLADTTPNFVSSTNIANGYVGAADGRHVLGVITTPAAAGPPVTGGGSYAPGSTVGGEIL